MVSKGQKTREKIIGETMRLLNLYGTNGTAVADIMEATGLKKGGIYRHFTSKEEMETQAILLYMRKIAERLDAAVQNEDSSQKRLENIIESLCDIATHPITPGGCLLMNLSSEADFGKNKPHPMIRKAFSRWRAMIKQEIRSGIENREFRPQTDADQFAAVCIAAIEGAIMMTGVYPEMQAHKHTKEYLINTVRSWRS
jgi:AcrR family transcriptional regulator